MLEKEEIEYFGEMIKKTVDGAVKNALEKIVPAQLHEHDEEEEEGEARLITERLMEDDLIASNLTNLDDDIQVVHRKASYGYPGTADILALFEAQARDYPYKIAKRLMSLPRNMNQYRSGEEGRSIMDMNATLAGSFTRPRRTISEDEEVIERKEDNGGMF